MSELRLNNNNNNNNNASEQDLILQAKRAQNHQATGGAPKSHHHAQQHPKVLSHHLSHQQLSSASAAAGIQLATQPILAGDTQFELSPSSTTRQHYITTQHQKPPTVSSQHHQHSASHQHLPATGGGQQQQQHSRNGSSANMNMNNQQHNVNHNSNHQHHNSSGQLNINYPAPGNGSGKQQQQQGAGNSKSASSGLLAAAARHQQQQVVLVDRSDSASLPSSGSASTSDSMFKRRRLGGSSKWQRLLGSCCCGSSRPDGDDGRPAPGAQASSKAAGWTLTPLGLLLILAALLAALFLTFHFKLFGLTFTCSLYGRASNASSTGAQANGKLEGFNMKNGAEYYLGITEMLQAMDSTVDPCNDFYNYACGAWTRRHSIPGDESRIDTFSVMRTDLGNKLRDLLEEEPDASDSQATIKAKTLYRSCVNESVIDKRGPEPLLRLLKEQFGGWPLLGATGDSSSSPQTDANNNNNEADQQQDWVRLMAILRTYNNEIIIGQTVGSHEHNSSMHAIRLYPAGLGLPSADYYNSSSRQFKAYETYLTTTAQLLRANNSNLASDIRDILEFETGLANISKPFERQGGATYHRMTIARLQKYTPAINWDTYFRYSFPDLAINSTEQVGLYGLDFFMDIAQLVNNTPSKKTVINYLLWRFVMNRVNNLGKQFADNQHEYAAEISGAKNQAPRHKVCVDYVNGNMGMAVSSLYVKRHFDAGSKQQAEIMIDNIRQSFLDILQQVDWMDTETRQEAIVKAKSMLQHIGFPMWIIEPAKLDEEYEHLSFAPESYFENVIQLIQSFAKETRIKLRQPSERDKWTVAPSIINAHYLRTKNLMSFPAGILQPPIYHTLYPKSLNYGGIGSIIGHEITHGFDNDGRHHDFQGNQRLWWHPNTIDRFIVRSQCMVRQYDDYQVDIRGENITVSGIRTLGENIADNGGLKEAFMAYRKYEQEHGPEDTLPGLNLTHHQMFFIKFAQNWCQNMTPQSMMNALKTWRHPLGRFRVIGTLSNLNEFSQAFSCPANSQMNPTNKCKVW